MLYLVLEDFAGGAFTASAGSVIDASTIDIAPLQASGLAVIPYDAPTMEPIRAAFLAARGSRPSVPDTAGDLLALLIAAQATGGMTELTGDVDAGPGPGSQTATVIGIQNRPVSAAAPNVGNALVWSGAEWAPDLGGITELTGDVLAGPGQGSQGATVVALQTAPVSAVLPFADGQVLQWDGAAWVPGTVPAGGSGGGGQTYFLNAGTAGDAPLPVPTAKELGKVAEVPLTTITSAVLPTDGSFLFVTAFVSDVGDPNLLAIPTGIWDFNIWARSLGPSNNANTVRFRAQVYKWDGATATLLATSGTVPLYDPTQVVQYACSALLPQTALLATDRIAVLLGAQATANNHQIVFDFGDAAPSHVHTTISTISGTGLVHVVNGVIQSPASPVNLAGGATEITGTMPIGNGGTGLATTPTDGQLLIGNTMASAYVQASLSAGPGISITNGSGSITIGNTGVTSVGATAPIASSGGATPTISISAATPTDPGSMSAADKAKLDGITSGAAVASVGGTAPIASSGGTTPTISISAATTLTAGSMSAADKTKLDGITAGAAVASVGASAPITSSGGTTPTIGLGTVGIANGGTGLTATPTDGQLLVGKTATNAYVQTTLSAGNGITVTNGSGTITIAASASGKDLSFQGEVTGTTPLVIGAVYLTSGTLLLAASSALLGTVSGGTATLRLVRQSTGVPLCSWAQPGALASPTLGGNANVTASDWYVFDLAGSAAGTVSRAYGARLEV